MSALKSIGADPELFLKKGDKHISAIGIVGGSKHDPRPTKHGAVQEDGVAAEFNINPASNFEQFSESLTNMLGDLNEILAKFDGVSICEDMHAVFDDDQLQDKEARRAGCDPDFNAWEEKINDAPDFNATNRRCVGGHVHIGADFKDIHDIGAFVKALDLYLAVPAVLVEDPARKELYGQAGSFRPKDYGVEYRTLSNFWIFKEESRKWVYDQVEKALATYKELDLDKDKERIVNCINKGDQVMAMRLIKEYKIQ